MENQKTLQEVLKENQQKYVQQRINNLKKQQRKEMIVGYFVLISVIALVVTLIYVTNKDYDNCVKQHNVNYCREGL